MKKRLALLFCLVLLVAACFFFWLIATQSGLEFVVKQVHRVQPETVRIVSAKGKLIGPLSLTGVSLRTPQWDVSIDKANGHWSPGSFFRRALQVDSVTATGVRLVLQQSANNRSTDPVSLPERLSLPGSVRLQQLRIEDLQVLDSDGGEIATVDVAAVSAQLDRSGDYRTAVAVKSSILNLQGSLHGKARAGYPLAGDIDWELVLPEFTLISGKTLVSGSFQELAFRQTIAQPYNLTGNMVLYQPLEDLRFDMDVSTRIDELSNIRSGLPKTKLFADLSLTGSMENVVLQAGVEKNDLLKHSFQANGNIGFSDSLLTVEQLEVRPDKQAFVVEGNGTVDFQSPSPDLNIEVHWRDFRWPMEGEPMLTSDKGSVALAGMLETLDVQLQGALGQNGKVTGKGAIQDTNRLNAELLWESVTWPADGSVVGRSTGKLGLAGRLTNGKNKSPVIDELTLESDTDTDRLGNIKFALAGRGTQQALELSDIQIEVLDGSLTGRSKVFFLPSPGFDLQFNGQSLNPAVLGTDYPGLLDLALSARGTTVKDKFIVALDALSVDGQLRNYPFALSARANGHKNKLDVEELIVESGSTRLDASGEIGEQLDLEWSLNSPDLSSLLSDAKGKISSTGKVSGELSHPSLSIALQATELAWQELSIAKVEIDSRLDAWPGGIMDIDLALNEPVMPGWRGQRVTLTGEGLVDEHRIAFDANSKQGDIKLELQGGYSESGWNAVLEAGTLLLPKIDVWELQQPAQLSVSREQQAIDGLCLGRDVAEVCLDADRGSGKSTLKYHIKQFPVSALTTALQLKTGLNGVVNSEGEFNQTSEGAGSVKAALTLDDGELVFRDRYRESLATVKMKPSHLSVNMDQAGLSAMGGIDFGDRGSLKFELSAQGPPNRWRDNRIVGELKGDIGDISFVSELIPEVDALTGAVRSDLRLAGTINAPRLNGGITISHGSVDLSTPGVTLENIDAQLSAANNDTLDIEVSAKSGQGEVSIDGTARIVESKPTVNLRITGREFEVLDTVEAYATVSPDLQLAYEGNRTVQVSGELLVPELAIRPRTLGDGLITVSGDQILVNEETGVKTADSTRIMAKVKVILGEQVSVEAFGLKASLAGDVTVKESFGREPTASGQLFVKEGSFDAYGQKLEITKGRLIYADGPVSKPGFDIEAIRNINTNVQVGIRARGAVDSPEISLFSAPEMTQTEQMSYLVLGRPLDDNTPSEQSAVSRAAVVLGLAGGRLLTDKLEGKLGLDQFTIGTELRETGEQAALLVGKYLTPRLFVSYGIGLFEPVSTLRLNYSINRNVKVITETTESRSGGDIVFTFEGGGKSGEGGEK